MSNLVLPALGNQMFIKSINTIFNLLDTVLGAHGTTKLNQTRNVFGQFNCLDLKAFLK